MESPSIPNIWAINNAWFEFSNEHHEAKCQHTALLWFIIHLNNKLGWKKQFGLPTQATMECLSIGDKKTYINALRDLAQWGFVVIVQEAKNQYQSCIIELCRSEITTALPTALTSALQQHTPQHNSGTAHSTPSSGTPIDTPIDFNTNTPIHYNTDDDADRVPDVEVSVELDFKEKKTPPPKVAPKGSPSVHSRIREIIQTKNPGYYWQGKDGSATKSIIKKIAFRWGEKHGYPPDDDQTVNAFKWLIDNLPEWYQNKWDACLIESKFESIIKEINDQPKNGKSKQSNPDHVPGPNGISPRLASVWKLIDEHYQANPV